MYIYNQEKINIVKEKLGLEKLNNEELCKEIFKFVSEDNLPSNLMEIDTGSARAAYWLKDTDIVIKVSYLIEDYDNEICFQGNVEKHTYEQYKDRDMCYKIYGISNNYAVIICEELEVELSVENLQELGAEDVIDYLQNEVNVDYECLYHEDDFYSFLSDYIEDYLLDRGYDIFADDFHSDNIGLDANGRFKLLDLGYGDCDGNTVKESIENALSIGKKARGLSDFYSIVKEYEIQGFNVSEILD